MQIFSEVFGANAGAKRDIMRVLKNGACSAQELASALGTQRGGHIARNLEELELAGFVGRDSGLNPETGSRARQGRYRLADNYTRFYLNFIEPHLPEIEADHFAFASLDTLPGWDSTLGLQFENLIENHASELLPYLNLSGIPILEGRLAPVVKENAWSDAIVPVDRLLGRQPFAE